MTECCSSATVGAKTAEKKMSKREILQCAKKLPYLVGLELVACEVFARLIGNDNAKQLLLPLADAAFDGDPAPRETETAGNTECNSPQEQEGYCASSHINEANTTRAAEATVSPLAEITDCKPLDLSVSALRHGADVVEPMEDTQLSVPLPRHPTANKKKTSLTKRAYTEEVLAAAIDDVRAGKLGTRRAAAIYGIPRSTLRNKVFRIDPTRRALHASQDGNRNTLSSGVKVQSPATETNRPLSSWDKMLDEVRRKHDLQAGFSRPFGMPPLFYNNECLLDCERVFSLSDPFMYDTKIPDLRQLVARVASQMLGGRHDERNAVKDKHYGSRPYNSNLDNKESGHHHHCADVVNDEKQDRTQGTKRTLVRDFLIGGEHKNQQKTNDDSLHTTLRDVITKTITEKVLGPHRKTEDFAFEKRRLRTRESVRMHSMASSAMFDYGMMPSVNVESFQSNDTNEEERSREKQAKRVRPKRGQYRRYKMELLMEAVRAVQHGEMSVHRAGSYYGVPHSTLEYKVKERHLLRQRKLAAAAASKSSETHVTTSDADATHQPSSNVSDDGVELEATMKENSNSNASSTSTCDDFDENNAPSDERNQSAPESQKEDRYRPSATFPFNVSECAGLASLLSGNPMPFASHPASFMSHFNFTWPPFMPMTPPLYPSPSGTGTAGVYPPGGSGLFVMPPPQQSHGMFASELLKSLQFKANSLATGSE